MPPKLSGMAPARPTMIKERASMVFLQYGRVDVRDGAFVLIDENGVRVHVPVGNLACILLETGTRVTHEAVKLAAHVGCLLLWVGDGGVRLYAAGQPGGARSDKLLYQAKVALDEQARLRVVRKMYELRFKEAPPERRSVDQLRGIEGSRVRKLYQEMAKSYGVEWNSRSYDQNKWDASDIPNRCLSAATACLYGISEAAILAAGYSPAIGFIHTGKPQSFVYDVADVFKFDTVVPAAFKVASGKHGGQSSNPERDTRTLCRDLFRQERVLKKLIPTIEEILEAGGLDKPASDQGVVPQAIPNKEQTGDAGHRH